MLKMLINKGTFNGVRVLNRSTANYLLTGIAAPASGVLDFLNGSGDWNDSIADWLNGCSRINANNAFLAYTLQTALVPNSISEIALPTALSQLGPGLSPNVIYWVGSQGSGWVADLDTGSYVVICVGHYNPATTANSGATNATTLYRYISQYI